MAVVSSRAERIGRPIAIFAIIAAVLIFLSPIYWIASTAFKPRAVATSVPPTLVFTPEVTPFIKLFTKRVQLKEPPTAGGLRRGALVGEGDLRRRRARAESRRRRRSSRNTPTASSTA